MGPHKIQPSLVANDAGPGKSSFFKWAFGMTWRPFLFAARPNIPLFSTCEPDCVPIVNIVHIVMLFWTEYTQDFYPHVCESFVFQRVSIWDTYWYGDGSQIENPCLRYVSYLFFLSLKLANLIGFPLISYVWHFLYKKIGVLTLGTTSVSHLQICWTILPFKII